MLSRRRPLWPVFAHCQNDRRGLPYLRAKPHPTTVPRAIATSIDSPALTPREIVESESPKRIRDHLSRESEFNPTRSVSAFTEQITHEYEDRFLVELIQNAYDAQPPGERGGRVHVRLDESEPEHATVYVANTGSGFSRSNFYALTTVAQSSKPPGEGIGNKGVGFRSVLQVCDAPEIYSCVTDTPTFDGYCFTFADDAQVREMVADAPDYEVVKRDFTRSLLPVPAESTDPFLRELRDKGLITVIRLVLSSEHALDLAREQIARLREPTPPIALFLDRLSSITVEHVDTDGALRTTDVTRHVDVIAAPEDAPDLTWVTTAGRRFLVASRKLQAPDIAAVVGEAIALGELDESWAAWDADVEVSLAVQLDGAHDETAPSTFTYLPMRVDSPLHAHLHAPFHTKLARLELNEESHFNAHLIAAVADLAVDAVRLLSSDAEIGLTALQRRVATVDLLSWNVEHVDVLRSALARADLDLRTSPLIPVVIASGNGWAGLSETRVWEQPGLDMLTVETLSAHASLVDPALGPERQRRLQEFACFAVSHSLTPSDDELAEWVEAVAGDLESASLAKWNRFLSEIADAFEHRNAESLQRRRILLDDRHRIRPAGPWSSADARATPTIFIPPRPVGRARDDETEAEVTAVPKNLQRAIGFLHPGIRVRTRRGSTFERTRAAALFARGNLVEPFELVAVLGHLSRLLKGKVSQTTYRQALSWTFAQEQASRANVTDLDRIGLYVPTAGGWIPADQAVFSQEWKTPRAATVAALVRSAGAVSPALRALGERLVLSPDEWPSKLGDREAFREFLSRCGVRDGLFPIARRARSAVNMNGADFSASEVAQRFGLDRPIGWQEHVAATWTRDLAGPYTPYTGQQQLWVVPGQDAFDELDARAKDRLAAALLETLADWPDPAWRYTFQRRSPHHLKRPDVQTWPSPARSFIERAPWFPMADAGRRDERYFVAIEEAWTFDEQSGETAPRYARLAPVDQRRRLANSPTASAHLKEAGLKVWNDRGSAPARLSELASLATSNDLHDADLVSVQRASAAAWSDVVGSPGALLTRALPLVVSRGRVLDVLSPSESEPPLVYVVDTAPGLVGQVLEAGELPVLIADPQHGAAIVRHLEGRGGFRVRAASAVDARAILDGRELRPDPDAGAALLATFSPWLARTVLAILDLRSSRFARVTDRVLHEVEARLRRTRIATGHHIQLSVDGAVLPAKGRLADSLHLDDSQNPLLVVNDTDLELPSWSGLEVIADDLAELLKQSQSASEIRAAALALQRSVGEWREPNEEELARVLRCSPEAVAEVLHNLRTSTDQLRELIAPFIAVVCGPDAARRIDADHVEDLPDLQRCVAELVGAEFASKLLASAMRAETVDDLRREMGTDLGALNRALQELGRRTWTFPDEHRTALNGHLEAHRIEASAAVRRRFWTAFVARDDLADYVAARDFRALAPDPQWLLDYETPPEDLLAARLDAWINDVGDAPADVPELAPIDQVRADNRRILDRILAAAAERVTAWAAKHATTAPEAWSAPQVVRDQLAETGALDFVVLAETELLEWLRAIGLWPNAMQLTLDANALGLTENDLSSARIAKSQAAQQRRRRRSELTFGDRTYDTSTDEVRDFAEAVGESADESFLSTRPRITRLTDLPLSPPKGPEHTGGGGGGHGGGRQRNPSDEQTAAIGLVGELLAYRWLRRAFPDATPDSWVSRNRRFFLEGSLGDDSLGYDFRVARRRDTLFFEVKATTTNEYEFDIGESELRAARHTPKDRYRIIFLRSVLTPGRRDPPLLLPQPLDPSYRQVNQGLRLRFDPGKAPRS